MAEKVVEEAQRFMIFLNTQWSIMANLFQASSALHKLQSASTEYDPELAKAHADINEVMSLTLLTFNEIISKIGEYREISHDAFAFLKDDLDRARNLSDQIAKEVDNGYTETVKGVITIVRNKLSEIGEKVNRHLKVEAEES